MKNLPTQFYEMYTEDLKNIGDLELDSEYIQVEDVLKAHYILADYFTDPSSEDREKMFVGVRDYNLLGSALGRQDVEYGGKRKYTDKIDICSTLFFGLAKDHAFHDGNKRTALLVLLFQLHKYGYYPVRKFKEFELLVLSVAESSLNSKYENIWKKFSKQNDPEIKTISYILRKKLTEKKDSSFHLDITTKEFCEGLKGAGVEYCLDDKKIKFERIIKHWWRKKEKKTYTINFYGWTRPVQAKMARDTISKLSLNNEFPSINKMLTDGDSNIYRLICDFEKPLRRLKDE